MDRPFEVYPLTADRWADLEDLFGPRGACAGCWCTFFKLGHREFKLFAGEPAHQMQQNWVIEGFVPGLLAYDGGQAVGWMAIEPREAYPRLARSRVMRAVDDQPVWSVTCFYTRKSHRRQGVTVALLRAGVAYARQMGGKIVEGYPTEARSGSQPDPFVFTGLAGAFAQAGFSEVARFSPNRPIFRISVDPPANQ